MIDSMCTSDGIIRPSKADTTETKRQIYVHNKTWRRQCESWK